MNDQELIFQHWIPRPRREVFAFFSEAKNLERITPPWLNFHITKMSTPAIEQGTLISYQLRIHRIPISWTSKIEVWRPEEEFVDVQIQGPYAKWHHTHSFIEERGGTTMTDRVLYKLRFGKVGQWVAGAYVKKDVQTIFAYRTTQINAIFGL